MKTTIRHLAVTAAVLGGAATSAATGAVHAAPSAAISRCHTGTLSIAPVPNSEDGGVGHIGFVLRVRSFAQQACYVDGYPGVQLIDANGHFLPTHLTWGGGYLFGNPAKTAITLKTGASAYFKLEWDHIPTGNEGCPVASNLLVTPPDEKVSIVVATPGIDACGGRIIATPMVSSAS